MDNYTKPAIGKFVIENLTVGMYDNPRCVYREYIQNSADAIDKAIDLGVVSKKNAVIHIQIDPEKKVIIFEDNGTGISNKKVASILLDIAQSEKEIGKEKGFRGIGRLGGLAYCEKLIFETSYKGENVKSAMIWDAKRLKQIINDRTKKEEAAQVIAAVTELKTESEENEKHYFKVTMQNVTNSDLLNESEIKEYLKMVAPLPFDSHFIFRTKIYDELKNDDLSIDEYNIYVNNEQVYKGYSTYLYESRNNSQGREKIGEVKDIVFFKAKDPNDQWIYWGWHSISNIQNKQLGKVNKSRGLRLRKNNIQIGDENRLEELFGRNPTDTRFHFYVIGEVYAFHKNLIPNGRRDDFEDDQIYSLFKEKLKSICAEIKRLANQTSDLVSAQRRIEKYTEGLKVFEQKQSQGFVSKEEQQQLIQDLQTKKKEAEEGKKTIERVSRVFGEENQSVPLVKIFNEVISKDNIKVNGTESISLTEKPVFRTDKLTTLSKAERKLLSKVFVIIKNVLSDDLAENLIKKVEDEFK